MQLQLFSVESYISNLNIYKYYTTETVIIVIMNNNILKYIYKGLLQIFKTRKFQI